MRDKDFSMNIFDFELSIFDVKLNLKTGETEVVLEFENISGCTRVGERRP